MKITTRGALALLASALGVLSVSAAVAERKAAPQGAVRFNAEGEWAAYRENWQFNTWGWGIGAQGFFPVDVDSDGVKELIFGVAGQRWAIADFFPENQEHRVVWKSPVMVVSHMRVVESGNTKTVWIAGNSDGIRVYDALTQDLLDTLPLPEGVSVLDMAVGDGNNDGSLDVILLAADRILFFDAVTLQARDSAFFEQPGENEFEVGNVDDDADTEIVLRDGRVLRVNGAGISVEWDRGEGFGYRMLLADIDGDDRDELVASPTGWSTLEAWEFDTRALKWERTTSHDVAVIRAFDVNADGVQDLVYADAQWGSIHAVDGETNIDLWSISNPEHGATDVVIYDADDDGALEVLWGAGYTSSGPDFLYRASVADQTIEWQSFDVSDNFYAVDVGDVDLDGRPELVFASLTSLSAYRVGSLMIHDAITHEPEYREIPDQAMIGSTGALRIANIDDDPQPEIILGVHTGFNASLIIIDGITHAREGEWSVTMAEPINHIDIADVNNDGAVEVLVGGYFYVYVVDPRTGAKLWTSPQVPGFLQDMKGADVGAPGNDIIVVANNVHRFRWSDQQQTSSVGTNYASALPLDVTGSAELEILAQRYDGPVDVLDGETLEVLSTLPISCSSLTNSTLVSLGGSLIAYVCDDDIHLYDVNLGAVMSSIDTGMATTSAYGSLVPFLLQDKPAFFVGGDAPHVFVDLIANQPPELAPINVSLHWRTATDITLSATDANDDPVSWQVVSLPAFGEVQVLDKAAGTVRYSPKGATTGSDSFRVRASDGYELSQPTEVNLTLTNTVPTATAMSFNVTAGTTTLGQMAGVDADGDPLTYAIGTAPSRGTLTVTSSGAISYVPAAGNGNVTATVIVSDGVSSSVPVTLTFRYASAGSGNGNGGERRKGAFDLLALAVLLAGASCRAIRKAR